MKKYLLFFWLVTSTITLFSQQITLGDLTTLLNKNGWYDIDILLQNKKWEYYKSENNGFSQNVIWSYKTSYEDRSKSLGWTTAVIENNKTELIKYLCFNEESYKLVIRDISKNGFIKGKDEINDDQLTQVYYSQNYTLIIVKSTNVNTEDEYYEGPRNNYLIKLTRKGSSYDPYNGLVTLQFDDSEQIQSEFYVTNGVKNGAFTEYFSNGNVSVKGNYSNGKLNGKLISFDEVLSLERTEMYFIQGKRQGKLFSYYNDSIMRIENYKNDTLDGPFVSFERDFSDYTITSKTEGYYKNDELTGKYTVSELVNNTYRPIQQKKFLKGELNGTSFIYKNDTLVVENYYQDMLEGPYLYYLNKSKSYDFLDSTKMTLIAKMYFHDDIINGPFLKFDDDENLIISGNYSFDNKSGEWKYYNKKYEKLVPNGLYSLTPFKNNLVDGIAIDYLDVNKIPIDCYSKDVELVVNDECFKVELTKNTTKTAYKNGERNGEYIKTNINGEIIARGNYLNDKPHGIWEEYEKDSLGNEFKYLTNYLQGKLHGKYLSFINGDTLFFGNFLLGDPSGFLINYENNIPVVKREFTVGNLINEIHYGDDDCVNRKYEVTLKRKNEIFIEAEFCNSDTIYIESYKIEKEYDQDYFKKNFLDNEIAIAQINNKLSLDGLSIAKEIKGNIIYRKTYKDGQLNGVSKKYDNQQKVVICENYINDVLTKTWYENVNGTNFNGNYNYYNSNLNLSYILTIQNGIKKKEMVFSGKFDKKIEVNKF
jgi:antitoxin component YwqK of YwqJK toxin-antitoxin module